MNGVQPLTAAQLLQVGHYFLRDNQLYQITAWDPHAPLELEARALADDRSLRFALTDLFAPTPLTRFGRTPADLSATSPETTATVVDAAGLPQAALARAARIIQTVEAVQAHLAQIQQHWRLTGTEGSLAAATRDACQALPQPISLSHYYRDRRLYDTYGADRARIAAALHRSTYQKTRSDPNAQHFIDTLIRRFYRTNPPLRKETLYQLALQLWQHTRHWWLAVDKVTPAKTSRSWWRMCRV